MGYGIPCDSAQSTRELLVGSHRSLSLGRGRQALGGGGLFSLPRLLGRVVSCGRVVVWSCCRVVSCDCVDHTRTSGTRNRNPENRYRPRCRPRAASDAMVVLQPARRVLVAIGTRYRRRRTTIHTVAAENPRRCSRRCCSRRYRNRPPLFPSFPSRHSFP